MHRYIHPSAPKPDEIVQAELEAAQAIDAYFDSVFGAQAMMHSDTGIPAPVLTKMRRPGKYPVNIEQAMLMEMASNGKLRVEQLCPAYADLLTEFMAYRAAEKKAA